MIKPRSDEQKAIIKALGGFAVTLGEDVSEERLALYASILAPYAAEDVLAAIRQASVTCRFFPKPAELIELMTGGKGGAPHPTVAWQELLAAIEDHGPYSSVEFANGAIPAAVEALGGWAAICALSWKELTLQRIQARFEDLYRDATRRGVHLRPGQVKGLFGGRAVPARTIAEIEAAAARRAKLEGIIDRLRANEPAPAPALPDLRAKTGIPAIDALAGRMALQ